ncbi:hypothetical protein F5Y08DRAFT_296278 [Xylaria arbuscula]|uniref:Inner kinetochore subunit AME1 domain-containing protein n=1 Tax=Xylaria arbuscula TaxID=114810 RepID=A0A9W8NAJ8_9PEZI|nr:hypothetical protein F5Y08DRAFT_296278 [Xylaria arbuscula]KAJ3565641.1 hypothetical protein NPX13_g7432 [Xylaria arbuscula]
MATSREERMQQRMRGAGRHEVADDSFAFILPVAETSPDPSPSLPQLRSEPNTSAKRRRLNNDHGSAESQPSSASAATRSSARLSSGQKSVQSNVIMHDAPQGNSPPRVESPPTTTRISARLNTLGLSSHTKPQDGAINGARGGLLPSDITMGEAQGQGALASDITMGEDQEQGDLEALPEPTPRRVSAHSRGSAASRRSDVSMGDFVEEVTESPVTAPGSGRRRRVERRDTLTQSTRLQRVVMQEEAGLTGELATSSPLVRKARQSMATVGTLSTRTTRASARKMPSSPIEALHGSSPLARHSRRSNSTAAASSARSTRSQRLQSTPNVADSAELSSPPDAAGTVSPRKPQLRRSIPNTIHESPYEIGASEDENQQIEAEAEVEPEAEPEVEPDAETDNDEAEEINDVEAAQRIGRKRPRVSPRRKQPSDHAVSDESPVAEVERPAKKSRSRREKVSPVKQAQPKVAKQRKQSSGRRKSNGDSIPVTVQRYTKPLRSDDRDSAEDILDADIPFTDHKSPNIVDVVLQMCEESLDKYISALHEEANQADGSASRKMFRTKLRVVEAFQEELRTRLQTQTIALDNLRTLKKRVRAAQKEKVSLRNEILRIRAEREQVALKMDAVRMRHETANDELLHQLNLSSAMDDIELAVENGKMAPELSPKEQRAAELANLDMLIAQITNQVSAAGDGGGTLKQIQDFNMFLERAAIALEGR